MYLKGLNASNNQIRHIDRHAFKDLTELQVLNLSQNHLSTLTEGLFEGLENLTEFQLGGDHIQKIETYTFWNNFTSFKTEDFSNVSLRLKVLDLSLNPFRNFNFTTNIFPCIVSLKLLDSEEGLDWVVTNKSFLHSVKNLSQIFLTVPKLSIIHLNEAHLLSLEFLVHANLTRLKFLSATGNHFTVVNVDHIKALPLLRLLNLKNNPFICSCEKAWFQNWSLQYSITQVLNFYYTTCNYPANYTGLKLVDFNLDSCKLDYDLICFIVSSTVVTLTMMVTLTQTISEE
ncbi:toll-like receptor 13 [Polyodon spathula]|uniref:toll-like receptor 13 n=1 Tax=Polyodon spathula TaxID=7913 RepID=UPI001B7EA0AD|nr:toll-like receptor 13 [Polyodon spathula]